MPEGLFKNIAFCTDFSENADEAFIMARDLAWRYGANLHIVHVMWNFSISPPTHSTYMPIEYDPNFIDKVTVAAMESVESSSGSESRTPNRPFRQSKTTMTG